MGFQDGLSNPSHPLPFPSSLSESNAMETGFKTERGRAKR